MRCNSTVLVLKTSLFWVGDTAVESLISKDFGGKKIFRIKPEEMDKTAWRMIVRAIIAADKVLVL